MVPIEYEGGASTATTQAPGDASTQIATDAFVQQAIFGANGFSGVNCRIAEMAGGSGGSMVTQRVYAMRVPVFQSAASASRTVAMNIQTAGTALTANQNLVGVFNSSGVQLGSTSSDQSGVWNATGPTSCTVGTFALVAGSIIYVCFLQNGTGTQVKFSGVGSGSNGSAFINSNLSGASLVASVQTASGATAMPGSITPASLSATSALFIAVGIS